MKGFAKIEDGKVTGVIESLDTPEIGGPWVDITDIKPQPGPNWTFDGDKYTPDVVVEYPKAAMATIDDLMAEIGVSKQTIMDIKTELEKV